MLKKLINLYNSRKTSERIMMICLVYLAVFVCYSPVKEASEELDKDLAVKQAECDRLNLILTQEAKVNEEFDALKEKLDESKMVDAQTLQLSIEQCALLAGIEYDISSTSSSKLDNYQVYAMTLKAKKVELANLVDFETLLIKQAPYIRVNTASINPSKRSIEATYKISSFVVQ